MSEVDPKWVGIVVTLFLAWSGMLFWTIKWLLDRYQRHIDQRFTALENGQGQRSEDVDKLQRELLELRAELPQQYVQREDWIRFSGQLDHKLDRLNAQQADIREWLSREAGRRKGED